jgi:5-methyltetrahydrofolate--homocysteine methyltransferase
MLVAGVAGNHVDIGLQAVADFFEMDGWRAVQLGTDVPAEDIVRAADSFQADLVGLSASQCTQLETVRQTIDSVRSAGRGEQIKIIVGGFAFAGAEHLALQVGADGYAPDPAAAVELGRHLVFGSPRPTDDWIRTQTNKRVPTSHPLDIPPASSGSNVPQPSADLA